MRGIVGNHLVAMSVCAFMIFCIVLVVLLQLGALGPYRIDVYDPGEIIYATDLVFQEKHMSVVTFVNLSLDTQRVVVELRFPEMAFREMSGSSEPYTLRENGFVWNLPFEGTCSFRSRGQRNDGAELHFCPGMLGEGRTHEYLLAASESKGSEIIHVYINRPPKGESTVKLSLQLSESAEVKRREGNVRLAQGGLRCRLVIRKNPDLNYLMLLDTRKRFLADDWD